MKRKLFIIVLIICSALTQVRAESNFNFISKYVASSDVAGISTTDLSLNLLSTFRTPTPYAPGYGTNVKLLPFSDADGFYGFTPRAGSTGVPVFGYSPYGACDYKVMKVFGYYYNCDNLPCRMYVYLSVVISGNTYYMYWPAYRENSSSDYTNFLQAA